MLSALQPDTRESDEAGADPFAHVRTRPKAGATGHPTNAAARTDPSAQSQLIDNDPFLQAISVVHGELCEAAAAAPRDAVTGALEDYRVLLRVLADNDLPLSTDACGTLIAHFDVHRTIPLQSFAQLVAEGLQAPQPPPQPQPTAAAPTSVAPPARPRVAPTQPQMGAYDPSQWTMSNQPVQAVRPSDVASFLGHEKASQAATNFELARALNGGLGQHARRGADAAYGVTGGKSTQMR